MGGETEGRGGGSRNASEESRKAHLCLRDRETVQLDPLAGGDEVRGREHGGVLAVLEADERLGHTRRGSLTLRAGYVEDFGMGCERTSVAER